MRIQRVVALTAAIVSAASGLVFAAAPAQAATTVTVNCATSSAENFTVTPGEQIIFSLNNACQVALAAAGATNTSTLQTLVNYMARINTGGSAVASVSGGTWTVTYTAGSNPGTDTLDVSQAGLTPRSLSTRSLTTSNDYSMTLPGDAPPPWLQAYGRAAGATCDAGWSPSWAQWPNNHTGGFVCVRSLVYNTGTGDWDARRSRR